MFSNRQLTFSFIVISVLLSYAACQTETNDTVTATSISEATVTSTTAEPVKNASCESHHNDCKGCVVSSQCFYCETNNQCYYKITKVLTGDQCDLGKINYLTCRVNFKYLIIGVSAFAGVAILIIAIFCCYCCCKKKGIKISKDDLKWARQREERKQIAAEKRKERAERTEEIRKKYGLVKDNPYQRFDAEKN